MIIIFQDFVIEAIIICIIIFGIGYYYGQRHAASKTVVKHFPTKEDEYIKNHENGIYIEQKLLFSETLNNSNLNHRLSSGTLIL
ncbi:hypothetical protein [Rickettsia asembonensis]|uniref:hypothetical protein n=1 Tax=Rickettsia asembonensis TaxID=1068590 RepID=UPI0023F86F3C|nr:hypothetical protein [Rickettsia asembonensis]